MRKVAIAIGSVVVLLMLAVFSLPFLVNVNKYHDRIQSELQQRTGRNVRLGNMSLKVFPIRIRVEDVLVGDDPHFVGKTPFATAKELFVSAKLIPLLRGDLQLDALELANPTIELIRDQQGIWNFSTLGKPGSAPPAPNTSATRKGSVPNQSAPPQQALPQQGGTSQPDLSLAKLEITNGQIAVTDYQKRQPRVLYDHIDLTLNDYAPGKPFKIDLAAHLPGNGKETLRIAGKGGPLQDQPLQTVFDGEISLDQVSLAGLQKFLNSAALNNMAFTASGTAHVKNDNSGLKSDGALKLEDARVNGTDIGYPISAKYNISADLNNDVYRVDKADLKLGGTPLSAVGTFNAGPTPAQVDMHVTTSNASVTEIARLAGVFGVAFSPGIQVAGKVDADVSARGAANNPALNGKVSARELVITGKDLPQAVQVTNVDLSLTPSSLQSNSFIATTGSTAVQLKFAMQNYTAPNSTVEATVRTQHAQLGEVLNIAKAYGVSAAEGMSGNGPIQLDVTVKGPTKNPAAMVYSGSGNLKDASLRTPNFTQPVSIRNADLQFSQNSIILNNGSFSLGSTNANGQVTLRNLGPNTTPQVQFALAADKFDSTEWQKLMVNAPVSVKKASLSLVPLANAAAPPAEAPLINRLIGSGTLQVSNVIYDQLQLSNAHSNVMLDRGLIRLSPVTAQIYGGTTDGTIVIDTRPTPSTYTVSSKLDHVDANQLLSSVSSVKKVLYGLLAANANTSFTSSGNSDFARTLNGNVNLSLLNGKVAGVDLLHELSSIGKFVQGGRQQEPFTNIVKLAGDFNIHNGVARTNNLLASIDGGTLAGKGAIDLAAQTIDMNMMAVLSQQYSQTVGGTGIGGYLQTALANSKGELVIPVKVSGSLTSPKFVPDVNALAQMKLQNLLPTLGNPGSLNVKGILGALGGRQSGGEQGQSSGLEGVLGALGGKQQQTGTQNDKQQQRKPADTVNDLLQGVFGGQKKDQQQQPEPPPK